MPNVKRGPFCPVIIDEDLSSFGDTTCCQIGDLFCRTFVKESLSWSFRDQVPGHGLAATNAIVPISTAGGASCAAFSAEDVAADTWTQQTTTDAGDGSSSESRRSALH